MGQEISPKIFNFSPTRLGLIQISRFGPFGQNKCMKVHVLIQLKAIEGFFDHFLAKGVIFKESTLNVSEKVKTFSVKFLDPLFPKMFWA